MDESVPEGLTCTATNDASPRLRTRYEKSLEQNPSASFVLHMQRDTHLRVDRSTGSELSWDRERCCRGSAAPGRIESGRKEEMLECVLRSASKRVGAVRRERVGATWALPYGQH